MSINDKHKKFDHSKNLSFAVDDGTTQDEAPKEITTVPSTKRGTSEITVIPPAEPIRKYTRESILAERQKHFDEVGRKHVIRK